MTAATKKPESRSLDYLYDSSFIVSGARDYARTYFRAAMGTAQVIVQPVYRSMFSELRTIPRQKVVLHPNCRLPQHMDTSYDTYLVKVSQPIPTPDIAGKDMYRFISKSKKGCPCNVIKLDLNLTKPVMTPEASLPSAGKPRNKGTQSIYRETSAQTIPWQPDGVPAKTCETTPEVVYLDKLEWGPGAPYRLGDLPADFHTTEIINKMRHARMWNEIVIKGPFPRWMKKRGDIIEDIETKDWIFREAEIDELQDIRLTLLKKIREKKQNKQTNRMEKKLSNLWDQKKKEMKQKVNMIRRTRDREIRKLSDIHSSGGSQGLCARKRLMRGMGPPHLSATDPASDLYAPVARHGYQGRSRHAVIQYDPSLLLLEDHDAIAKMPEWVFTCAQNLHLTCSGHDLPKDETKMCPRMSKWSEEFLGKLHEDLKKARIGAGLTAGPLTIVKALRAQDALRPATPEVQGVPDSEELNYQAALLLQRLIRGRAVQCLMYDGRTRAAELTEELKTTHGLQKEDKIRIAKEEAKARDYNVIRSETEQKEDAITALVDELCGGAVSSALDFLEKELRRLQEERKQHAYILIAIREKQMREAAEAGCRQKEEHRRREHDEMFRQVLGITHDTIESYLHDIIKEGVALNAEEQALKLVEQQAKQTEITDQQNLSTAEQNELIAELVQQFLLPAAHKTASQQHIQDIQRDKLKTARHSIFGLLDEAETRESELSQCPMEQFCTCENCTHSQAPVATTSRDDPRWKATKARPPPVEKSRDQRYPLEHELRCVFEDLLEDVVQISRVKDQEREHIQSQYAALIKENVEILLDAKHNVQESIDIATGVKELPVRLASWHYFSKHIREDALARTEFKHDPSCPRALPSEIRAKEVDPNEKDACLCKRKAATKDDSEMFRAGRPCQPKHLPSALRALEELKQCKCDQHREKPSDSSSPSTATPQISWSRRFAFIDDE